MDNKTESRIYEVVVDNVVVYGVSIYTNFLKIMYNVLSSQTNLKRETSMSKIWIVRGYSSGKEIITE